MLIGPHHRVLAHEGWIRSERSAYREILAGVICRATWPSQFTIARCAEPAPSIDPIASPKSPDLTVITVSCSLP
jgi:hypothetical protein